MQDSGSEASTHASTPAVFESLVGTPTDSSQTSHSPSVAHANPARSNPDDTGFSNEVTDFLSDLSNFLPLGCLISESHAENTTELGLDHGSFLWQKPSNGVYGTHFDPSLLDLAAAGWINVRSGRNSLNPKQHIHRIYVLPGDVGLRWIDRQSKRLTAALQSLAASVDISTDTWDGRYSSETEVKFDRWAKRDEGSLFYMFNTIPSPRPKPSLVKEKYTREALEDLLDPTSALIGLKTTLYPYQRRSAALMLQREAVSTLILDPRLEPRTAPDGSLFYYGPRDLLFNRNARYYEASRGGILAETMGLGKTLICLSLVLSTKSHLPKVPPAYALPRRRNKTASLAEMAVSAINRKSVPWKVEFERIKHASQDEMSGCIEKLERIPPTYEIPIEPVRWNRKTVIPPPQKKTLAATTILVVPRNLCKQWHSEIQKHIVDGLLRILLMEEPKSVLPPAEELVNYDIILFSRNRFELEVKDGADTQGRRMVSRPPSCTCPYIGATRTVDCHCVKVDDLYESPLKLLHFKRLIIDEGHFFSASQTVAVTVAKKLVTADHRWVVSGTPAKDLLGVEAEIQASQGALHDDIQSSRDAVLDQRRQFHPKEDTTGAVKALGTLASNFLRIRPWTAEGMEERAAIWEEYIYRHEDYRRRTFSGFSTCLRRTLEAMVVKTQPEDVEQDIDLPPLSHEVVRLEPSFYDKVTANMFTFVLLANAITSERSDSDYLFHKSSATARYQLIGNLRQSAFFWTGFSVEDIRASQKNSRGYLSKEGVACSPHDRRLLDEALRTAESMIASAGWKALSQSHEIGLFVDDWPQDTANFWAFGNNIAPLLTGLSQLLEAQKHVNERVGLEDPGDGLAGLGVRAMKRAEEGRRDDQVLRKEIKPTLSKAGINLSGEPTLKRRASVSSPAEKTAKRAKKLPDAKSPGGTKSKPVQEPSDDTTCNNTSRRRWSDVERSRLSKDSPFARSRIVGTTSAKMSYLTSQILKYHEDEKILIFYEGDNIAYYIAQMLELLHIKHEIYAKSLAAHLKSEYVVRFNEEPQDRILLMDIKHAAFGLNVSAASRIYFVNPVCRPNIEAQAIKRAHRIGQRRKVVVETLLLKGTIEEKMHERARRMTNLEHHDVSHLEDDSGMREIIQSAGMLPIAKWERSGPGQMAPLDAPQRLWARPSWQDALPKTSYLTGKRLEANAVAGNENDALDVRPKGKKSKTTMRRSTPAVPSLSPTVVVPRTSNLPQTGSAAFPTSSNDNFTNDENDEGDEPLMRSWRRRSEAAQATAMEHMDEQNTLPSSVAFADDVVDGVGYAMIAGSGAVEEPRRLSVAELLD